jgi:hypothetical protein
MCDDAGVSMPVARRHAPAHRLLPTPPAPASLTPTESTTPDEWRLVT